MSGTTTRGDPAAAPADHFIARWTGGTGGAERANYAMFLTELCDLLGMPHPDPAGSETRHNDYVFERGVKRRDSEGLNATLRIDLYKKGCFILEAKQSRSTKIRAYAGQPELTGMETQLGRRSIARGWDAMMVNARRQAEDYVFRLEPEQPAPPFLIVCDVGHCFEIYSDFSGTGRAYVPYPDRRCYRLFLEDLRDPAVRSRLVAIWSDPHSLDPARHAALVTSEIAARLAEVSKRLDERHPPEEVAHFLMRCIFTMFAQSVDLLPRGAFTGLIEDCLDSPGSFAPLVEDLWARMDEAEHSRRFFSAFRTYLRHFNGNLFRQARAFPLGREEIGELLAAARKDWTRVEPAIFGTLLERALKPQDRDRLGAHYTPRAYVERLVQVTVMEPLRADWRDSLVRIEAAMDAKDKDQAIAFARAFHTRLCRTRVLDPACGTGNFLYVALELMKVLEGEVLEKLAELGFEEFDLERQTVDPHQFLGLELNPRAAAIAELVVWIGYLQQHYRTKTGHPSEPILRAFRNINGGGHAGFDAVLTWDGYPVPSLVRASGDLIELAPNPRRPEWPEADFIVGNPPFIGGKDLRSELGGFYAEALWAAHPWMNRSADFVMYWWDRAADILTRKGSALRRFGFITTNSISQVFQRRVVERHLGAKQPLSLVFAVPDHPWTKASEGAAAVRIAMTVAEAGTRDGLLLDVTAEADVDTDTPHLTFSRSDGRINADLTVGVDVTKAGALLANEGLCSPGVKLHGSGFIVTPAEAAHLGLGRRPGLEKHIRPYRNGRDLTAHPRGVMVIDLFGLGQDEVRQRFPEVYQHLADTVRVSREIQYRSSSTPDALSYLESWWEFGKPRTELRHALIGTSRYIATVETAKHRVFQFLEASILPDNMLIAIGTTDAAHLAILSSIFHTTWAPLLGGWLGYGNDPRYTKSRCFDPFPFPEPTTFTRDRLRALGEELDATRKRVLAEHADLTLTGLYNVLQKLKAGMALDAGDEDVKHRGLVLVLKDLHDEIDRATADAYGWPRDLSEAQIVARLVALNAERAAEEASGVVRWLRPEFQAPRFGKGVVKSGELDLGPTVVAFGRDLPVFPRERFEQPLAIKRVLATAGVPMDAPALARAFRGPWKPRLPKIAEALAVLARYGDVMSLPDGRYAARRVA